jgi:hypothetical protein
MKKSIFLFAIFASVSANAYEGFYCFPSFRSTRMEVLVVEDKIQFTVVNPMGYKFMPQFSSSGSIYNLAFFRMQGDDLQDLGDRYVFSWPREKCQLESSKFLISCQGEALAPVGEVKAFGLSTTDIIERTLDQVYEKRRFRQTLDKDNIYFVDFEYHTMNCEKFKK